MKGRWGLEASHRLSRMSAGTDTSDTDTFGTIGPRLDIAEEGLEWERLPG